MVHQSGVSSSSLKLQPTSHEDPTLGDVKKAIDHGKLAKPKHRKKSKEEEEDDDDEKMARLTAITSANLPLLREIGDVKVKKAIDDGKLAKPKDHKKSKGEDEDDDAEEMAQFLAITAGNVPLLREIAKEMLLNRDAIDKGKSAPSGESGVSSTSVKSTAVGDPDLKKAKKLTREEIKKGVKDALEHGQLANLKHLKKVKDADDNDDDATLDAFTLENMPLLRSIAKQIIDSHGAIFNRGGKDP